MSTDGPLMLTAPTTAGTWFDPDSDLAIADRMARLPPEQRAEVLDVSGEESDLDLDELRYDFRFWGRPSQLYAVDSTAHITAILSGRGFGKTRTLSEIAHKLAENYPGSRGALVARTTNDVRAVMVKGESGLLETVPPDRRPKYVPNNREVTWPNGTVAHTFTASVPDMLRGPQFDWTLCDELAAWPDRPPAGSIANAWDNVKLATRLGDNPQIFVATTPRRVPAVIELINGVHADSTKYRVIRGATSANRHLADIYHRTIVEMYSGTSLARQELGGELLGDVSGALLRMDQIPRLPTSEKFNPLDYPIRIVAVDPSVSDKPRDECGIVVVVATNQRDPYRRKAFVVADESLHGSPGAWAKRVSALARQYKAFVVAEDNQGGEMVRTVIHIEDDQVPVVLARSQDSKAVRAEPVVLGYERRQVFHVDYLSELEAQLTSWVPDESKYSPDRLDALVVGCSAALVTQPSGMSGRIRLGRSPGSVTRSRTPTPQRPVSPQPVETAVEAAYRPQPRLMYAREDRQDRRRRFAERRARRRKEAEQTLASVAVTTNDTTDTGDTPDTSTETVD